MTDPVVQDTADALADHLLFLHDLRRDIVRRGHSDLATRVYEAERLLARHLLALGDRTDPHMVLSRP